jgi:hypothetical protein
MYILKTEEKDDYFLVYWTLDGEHIFRIQTLPINKKGNDNIDDIKPSIRNRR